MSAVGLLVHPAREQKFSSATGLGVYVVGKPQRSDVARKKQRRLLVESKEVLQMMDGFIRDLPDRPLHPEAVKALILGAYWQLHSAIERAEER